MYNRLVNFFYRTSFIIPFIFSISISNLISDGKNHYIGMILLLIFFVLSWGQVKFISKSKKILIKKRINVITVEKKSNEWIVALVISYFVPFLNHLPKIEKYFTYENINIYRLVMSVVIFIIIILTRNISNNIVLVILKYKSYSISTEQGLNMTLLSKRELRNANNIGKVIRIFENLIMEVE